MRASIAALGLALVISSATGIKFEASECGKTKNCAFSPDACADNAAECKFIWSYAIKGSDKVEFELWTSKGMPNPYIAVGLSADSSMGDDYVTGCYKASGSPAVASSYNDGYSNKRAPAGLKHPNQLVEFVDSDSEVYCKFTQDVNKDSTDNFKPDLSKTYVLLGAVGKAGPAGVGPHTFRTMSTMQHLLLKRLVPDAPDSKEIENNEVKREDEPQKEVTSVEQEPVLKRATDIGSGPLGLTGPTKLTILRCHAVAMLFGWLGFLATGIFGARYLRNLWPDTTVSGLKIWFHIHRTLNVIGVLLILAGSVLVFIAKDLSWTGPSVNADQATNVSPGAIHSIVGAVSVILAVLQPFGATCRCSVDHPRRSLFNFFHRAAGLLAALLAIAAIIIAVFYFVSLWNGRLFSTVVLLAFLLIGVVVAVVQEVVKFKDENEQQRIVAIEMRSRGKSTMPSDSYYFRERQAHASRHKRVTVILFLVFTLAGFVAATLLAYSVLDATK